MKKKPTRSFLLLFLAFGMAAHAAEPSSGIWLFGAPIREYASGHGTEKTSEPLGLLMDGGASLLPTIFGWQIQPTARVGYIFSITGYVAVDLSLGIMNSTPAAANAYDLANCNAISIASALRLTLPLKGKRNPVYPFVKLGVAAFFRPTLEEGFSVGAESAIGILWLTRRGKTYGLEIGAISEFDTGIPRFSGFPIRLIYKF